MVDIRRVVTGVDSDGRSCVSVDDLVPNWYEIESQGGKSLAAVWETEVPVHVDQDLRDTSVNPLPMIARGGKCRFIHVVEPPHSRRGPQEQLDAELAEKIGDRDRYFTQNDHKNLHKTPTVDVLYVVSGSIDLILESDVVTVSAGDFVIQRETWHGWQNRSDEPCVMVGVNMPVESAELDEKNGN
jgi:mannose-6-phosphate isomerase-like protein (cupin superfamily)